MPCCRERGLLAEGAKFLVASLEVDLARLEAADTDRDLRSFYFFPLLRPGHPDTAELATRRGCGDQCRCRLRDPQALDNDHVSSHQLLCPLTPLPIVSGW